MNHPRIRYRTARGGLYVWVLGVAALMTLMVLSGLEFTQIAARKAELTRQMAEARVLARAALEWGLEAGQSASARSSWAANSTPLSGVELGRGAMTLTVSDPLDGNLSSGLDDPVLLTATGKSGVAKQILQARLTTEALPLECLEASLCAGGNVALSSATLSATGLVATNAICTALNSNVNASIEAAGSINGSQYVKSLKSGLAAKSMPTAASVSTWTAKATSIAYSSLNSGQLRRALLSPGANPYGAVSPQGIYVINCGGQTIELRDVRIVGTLIILNPGSGSMIRGGISLEPVNGQPALIVQGSIEFALESSTLSELSTLTNFNPPSTPYNGSSNLLVLDSFPSQFGGLIYVSGDATISAAAAFNGVLVVGGKITISAAVTMTVDTAIAKSPPEGFRIGTRFVLAPGSIQQIVDP